jgi:hypothetical protein
MLKYNFKRTVNELNISILINDPCDIYLKRTLKCHENQKRT